MPQTRSEFCKIFQLFNNICQENKIWFSLSNKTLLSAIKKKEFYLESDYLEVMMTKDSFTQLIAVAKEYIKDCSLETSYLYLNPFFRDGNISKFIKINIVTKALSQKAEKIFNFKNRQRVSAGRALSGIKKTSFKRFFYKATSFVFTPLTWQEVCAKIVDEKYNGYYEIYELENDINKHWLPSLTFEMDKISFLDVEGVPVIKEFDLYLNKKFGFKWQDENWVLKTKKHKDFSFVLV